MVSTALPGSLRRRAHHSGRQVNVWSAGVLLPGAARWSLTIVVQQLRMGCARLLVGLARSVLAHDRLGTVPRRGLAGLERGDEL